MITDLAIESVKSHVLRRVWVMSDLQQSLPERATYCMTRAVEDYLSLSLHTDAICYLGDSVEGDDLPRLEAMTSMQVEQLEKVGAPVYYVIGNHDFDYFRKHRHTLDRMTIPFYDVIRQRPGWHVAPSIEDFYFMEDMGPFVLLFLTDHAAEDGSWFTTHGLIRGFADEYPYTKDAYRQLMERVAKIQKPVFSLSHYAYAGGNRAAPLFDRFLPLPQNLAMHFYGHAHVGDVVWAGKDCYRQIAAVDNQDILQINVASLENYRGSKIRTTVLEYYDTGDIGVLFRNHTDKRWDHYLVESLNQNREREHENEQEKMLDRMPSEKERKMSINL